MIGFRSSDIDGMVTITMKTFQRLKKQAEKAEKLERRMESVRREITDIVEELDESEMMMMLMDDGADESRMTDRQIANRYDTALSKVKLKVSERKLKRLIRKYIDGDACDGYADLKGAEDAVLDRIRITVDGYERRK